MKCEKNRYDEADEMSQSKDRVGREHRNKRQVVFKEKVQLDRATLATEEGAETKLYRLIARTSCVIDKTGQTDTKLEKVALDGSVECCAPPPRWCDLEV